MRSVAVVIPVYNGAKYLRAALDSVMEQTHPADEVHVIDDGSSDDSAAIAASYPGVRVTRQQNGGVSAARNRGVELADTEWIAFLDQDDLFVSTKLERQLAALEAAPEAGPEAGPGSAVCVCQSAGFRGDDLAVANDTGSAGRIPASEEIADKLRGSLRFPPGAVVMKRQALLDAGGFSREASPCEDWDLWLRLTKSVRFVRCDEPLLRVRTHDANESNHAWKMLHAEMRAYERHVAPEAALWLRPMRRAQAYSRALAGVALVERAQGRPHLGTMAQSVLHFPPGDWRRYKVLLHMVLTRAGLLR